MVQFVAKLVQTERNTKRKRIFFVLKGQQRIALSLQMKAAKRS